MDLFGLGAAISIALASATGGATAQSSPNKVGILDGLGEFCCTLRPSAFALSPQSIDPPLECSIRKTARGRDARPGIDISRVSPAGWSATTARPPQAEGLSAGHQLRSGESIGPKLGEAA